MFKKLLENYKESQAIISILRRREDFEKLKIYENNNNLVDDLLGMLAEEDRYILIEKYIEDKTWLQIYVEFLKKFSWKEIEVNTLQTRSTKILRRIEKLYGKVCA